MPRNGSGIYSKPAGTTAVASTTIESAKYNSVIDDLVTDANTPRPVVAGGTGATTAGAALTALGAQPLDAGLTSIAGLTTAADRMIYTTAADTYAVATLTAAGRAILDDADAAAQRTTLGAQASDATLTSLSGLSLVAGDLLYATGADTLVRLPKGTAGQVLAMNAGATAPEWGGGSGWTLVSQFYTGTSAATVDTPAFVAGFDYAIRFSWVRGVTNPSTLGFAPFRVVAGSYPTAAALKGSDSNYFNGWMEILAPMQTADQHHYFVTYAATADNNTVAYFGLVSGNYGPNYASTYGGVNDRISGLRFTRGSGNVSGGTMDLFRRPTNMT